MDEEELVDPKVLLEKQCSLTKACKPLFMKLQECNARVMAKERTEETCMEELFDWTMCTDKCVAKRLFKMLK